MTLRKLLQTHLKRGDVTLRKLSHKGETWKQKVTSALGERARGGFLEATV